ncbi:lysophospholipase [Pseudomonas fluorescens]|uniref:alpha/beta hydrolase n=1 Tax=Pseudomonas fluorescens TaxID=294 RepID=UPI003F99CE27
MERSSVSFINGSTGRLAVHEWESSEPLFLALLVHGYGEHLGRYDYVAHRLRTQGAYVFGPDHQGHGQSDGERVLIHDFASVVDDLYQVAQSMVSRHPGLPLVLIGHSMGGLIATRYAQLYSETLAALVLSGPLLGRKTAITSLLDLPSIPNEPLDVSTLSRDPSVGEKYADDPLIWHGPFKRPTLLAMQVILNTIDRGPKLGKLATLWLHGGGDRLVRMEETRTSLNAISGEHFEMEIYPNARHEIFNETNKEVVLNRALIFIDSVLMSF